MANIFSSLFGKGRRSGLAKEAAGKNADIFVKFRDEISAVALLVFEESGFTLDDTDESEIREMINKIAARHKDRELAKVLRVYARRGNSFIEQIYALAEGTPAPRYDPRYADPRFAPPAYPDPRYADPRYTDPRFAPPAYPDPRYDPRYADSRFAPPAYPDPRYDPRYADSRYAPATNHPEETLRSATEYSQTEKENEAPA